MFTFLLLFAKKYDLKITQIFPIRGHSYCTRDRKFSILTRKLKKVNTIETIDRYLDIINETDNFVIKKVCVLNFDNLKSYIDIPKNEIKLMNSRVIVYHNDLTVKLYDDYDIVDYRELQFISKIDINDFDLNLKPDIIGSISKDKLADVRSLCNHLKQENAAKLNNYLNEFE